MKSRSDTDTAMAWPRYTLTSRYSCVINFIDEEPVNSLFIWVELSVFDRLSVLTLFYALPSLSMLSPFLSQWSSLSL